MSETLPTPERIAILTNRIANLKNGSGDFLPFHREQALWAAENALFEAQSDLLADE